MDIYFPEISLLFEKIFQYAPKIGISLLLFIIGWMLAFFLKILISKVLNSIRFNLICDKLKISEFLRKGQINYMPSELIGVIVYWTFLIFVLFVVADILGINILQPLIELISNSLPNIIKSLFVMVIGCLLAVFIGNFVQTIANNAAYPHSVLLSKGIKWAGIIFVLSISIEILNIGSKIISATFQIVLGAIVFSVALSFALGCKDIAKDLMERFMRNLEKKTKGSRGSDLEG